MSNQDSASQPTAYGSARDLPSFRKMSQQIQAGKLITFFIARRQRAVLIDIERQMEHLADVVDRFYVRLGPRNWIFHDSLSVSTVEALLGETTTPEDAEARFIQHHRGLITQKFGLIKVRNVPGLRERFRLIERAARHYEVDEFDSCVLHLIAIMDGFVNDFQPVERKGLASRTPSEMVAWDSVVGHHLGLTHALKAFTRTVKKRVDSEVFELHRHGIMHGSIVNYNNAVVATKAWNMLFALADWANATVKSQTPVPPLPSFRDILRKVNENRKFKEKVAAWSPKKLDSREDAFEEHEIYQRTYAFLVGWRERNFGVLANYLGRRYSKDRRHSQLAGKLRQDFDGFQLAEFCIVGLEAEAPAIWISRGSATVNGRAGAFECRWALEAEDGSLGFGVDSAEWRLVFCSPVIWSATESQGNG
ncbi:hypothetical protein AB0I28_33405 [Phytomonospora sp. NPDC050363]|uniref:hypothetical protein n=1 Tax=Phytomonospora sp. NPDC050363 TaxID=3155642 RepID=UPI003400CEC3